MASLKREAQGESGGKQVLQPTGLPLCLAFEAGRPKKLLESRALFQYDQHEVAWEPSFLSL